MRHALSERVSGTITRYCYFFLGNLFYALSLNLFFLPNRIAAGGFAGIATVLSFWIPLPVGTLTIFMNIPFLIWSFFVKGWRYTLRTIFSVFVYAIMADFLVYAPCLTYNILMASLFGGTLYGMGAVCMAKSEASAGGSDLVARLLLHHFPSMSLGRMLLLVDGFCIIFAILTYRNIELGLCGIVALYTCSVFSDKLIAGFKKATICYIVTDLGPDQLSRHIMVELHRGVTCQKGIGMFQNTERDILMVVVRPREVYKLQKLVKKYDPNAFFVAALASEVQGGGFHSRSDHYDRSISL